MNEDGVLIDDEELSEKDVREVGIESDLPRIIVGEDEIIVLDVKASGRHDLVASDDSWVERDIKRKAYVVKEGIDVEDAVVVEDELSRVLEDMVGGASEGMVDDNSRVRDEDRLVREGKGDDFYEAGGNKQEFYETDEYETRRYKAGEGDIDYVEVKIKVKEVGAAEEERRGGRSILEIAGFEDEEAAKKRKERKEFFER